MKTAQEMYDFCKKNKYWTGLSKGYAIKMLSVIEKNLQQDEDVKLVFFGNHNYDHSKIGSLNNSDGGFAYALTDHRLLFGRKKILFGDIFKAIALSNLNDISINTDSVWGSIVFDTLKEKFSIKLAKGYANKVFQEIHSLTFKPNNTTTSSPTPVNVSSELRDLKALLDDGIITQEEFDNKKAKLLNL